MNGTCVLDFLEEGAVFFDSGNAICVGDGANCKDESIIVDNDFIDRVAFFVFIVTSDGETCDTSFFEVDIGSKGFQVLSLSVELRKREEHMSVLVVLIEESASNQRESGLNGLPLESVRCSTEPTLAPASIGVKKMWFQGEMTVMSYKSGLSSETKLAEPHPEPTTTMCSFVFVVLAALSLFSSTFSVDDLVINPSMAPSRMPANCSATSNG